MRIAINGFGRIGRCVMRALGERKLEGKLSVVAINDPAKPDMLAHLLRYDSTHGVSDLDINLQDGNRLHVNGMSIQLSHESRPDLLNWQQLDIDCVLECSGKFRKHAELKPYLDMGIGHVIASHPVNDADISIVYGVNHESLELSHQIISNASCTTNCLVPLIKVLHDNIAISSGAFTTIHAYTNDQRLLDQPGSDFYRSRAGALSIIPSTTGAASAVEQILPDLRGRLTGMAVRVPTPNVSMVDFHFISAAPLSVTEINQWFQRASNSQLSGILAYTEEPLVSSDFLHNPASAIFDASQTAVIAATNADGVSYSQAKVMAWYDNEWGFSNRMLDTLLYLGSL